jgi:hypothetical protein
VRVGVGELGKIDLLDIAHGLCLGRLAAHFARGFERESHILLDRFPRQQLIELLKHEHAVGAGPANGQSLEAHAALGGRHVATHRLEQGRLAAARWSEQHEPIGAIDVEADAVGGGDEVPFGLVLQRDAVDLEQRRRTGWSMHGVAASVASRGRVKRFF